MNVKDWQRLIEDFWWERYSKTYSKMNERTRMEIEELAERIDKEHRCHIREDYDDDV